MQLSLAKGLRGARRPQLMLTLAEYMKGTNYYGILPEQKAANAAR